MTAPQLQSLPEGLQLDGLSQKTFRQIVEGMSPEDVSMLQQILSSTHVVWWPHPKNLPQIQAYNSKAFEILYGGAAGGGKSDLLLGMARNKHRRSLLLRREFPDLERSLITRAFEFYGDRKFYNGSNHVWKLPVVDRRRECSVEFGHMEQIGSASVPGDESQYASAAYDLVGFDQLEQFPLFAYEFMFSRARSVDVDQEVHIVSSANWVGENVMWILDRWQPWFDGTAQPGEILWFSRMTGDEKERRVPDGRPIWDEKAGELVYPTSRTFLPAKLRDNPFLSADPGYLSRLQALPEPFRSALKDGKIEAMLQDDALQVIPREWVRAAMARWQRTPPAHSSRILGVDVSRGGEDKYVLAPRIGNWFDELRKYPGRSVPTGQDAVTLLVPYAGQGYQLIIDVIGVGAAVYDLARGNAKWSVASMHFAEKSTKTDKSGRLSFVNKRAECYWLFREMLDPDSGLDVQLPPDSELEADLCAPRWKMMSNGIVIESKDQIRDRLGRSPDCGDAVVIAASRRVGGASLEEIEKWRRGEVEMDEQMKQYQSGTLGMPG